MVENSSLGIGEELLILAKRVMNARAGNQKTRTGLTEYKVAFGAPPKPVLV
jgi:hypothetical protein